MTSSIDNVTVGPGLLYTAPIGESFPTDPDTAVGGNWVEAGRFGEDGLNFAVDTRKTLIRSANDVDPIRGYVQAREITIEAMLLEATPENLQLAFGVDGTIATDAGPPTTKTLTVSDDSEDLALLIRVEKGFQQTYDRDIHVARVTFHGAVSMPINRQAARSAGIRATALTPTSGSTLVIVDQTGAPS